MKAATAKGERVKRASVLLFCCLCVCLMASAAFAGGFQLFEYGTRAVSMGTANYAVGDDASVIAYNPALMTQFESAEVLAGVAAIAPSTDVTITNNTGPHGTGKFSTEDQTFMVPHAYYVQPMTDDVTLGAGIFTRFGLGTKYPDGWAGRGLLQEVMLESVSFQPTVAFKATEDFSFAIGVEVIHGSMFLKRAHPGGGSAEVDVEGTSVGGNISASYRFNDAWNMGFIYRSPIKFTGHGSVEAAAIGQDGDATVSATFPSSFSIGVGYTPFDAWTFEGSVIHTRWDHFDEMKFRYSGVNPALLPDDDEKFFYKNTWRFQLGAEYDLNELIDLRAGYVYDQTPTRHDYASVMLPANDRQLFSLGIGFEGQRWTCDLNGMYITTKERRGMSTTNAFGTYTYDFTGGRTWIAGLSVGYSF